MLSMEVLTASVLRSFEPVVSHRFFGSLCVRKKEEFHAKLAKDAKEYKSEHDYLSCLRQKHER